MRRFSAAFICILLVVLAIGAYFLLQLKPANSKQAAQPLQGNQAAIFDKNQHSAADPTSLWVVVNKNNPLPESFVPESLVTPNVTLRLAAGAEQMQVSAVLAPALEELFAAAAKDGVRLKLSSGYRSYRLQKQFYDGYVAKDGQGAADTYSARPGASEHQTGLAADIMTMDNRCSLEVCFADTAEGKWLATHAAEHGFTIRYPKGKEAITSYEYEPWHIRYIGFDLAAELAKTAQVLEEFFVL